VAVNKETLLLLLLLLLIVIITLICHHHHHNHYYSSAFQGFDVTSHFQNSLILHVVLYGRETWSLTTREERKLRVFENRVLRRIFGPERDEVTAEWRRLHNKERFMLCTTHQVLIG
jgi:dihydrofolate reductase